MATGPTRPRGAAQWRAETLANWLSSHWLLAANAAFAVTISGAALAPLLQAVGWTPLATLVYLAYRPFCPQRPAHSFFLFGAKLALEQRMLAIAAGMLLGGLLFVPLRARLRPLSWPALLALNLPMLIDVLSQTAGLRGSDWPWRVSTGLLGSLAAVWWAYPYLERAFANDRRARALLVDARSTLEHYGGSLPR